MNKLTQLKLVLSIFLISFVIFSCKKGQSDSKDYNGNSVVSVAAAANLRDVLEELKEAYIKENSGRKVEISFASSGLLVQQILNGAPFDLFLSADSSFPEKLKRNNKTFGNSSVYTYGRIALWSSNLDVSEGLKVVLNPKVRKIAIANPKLAPYGKNTVEALKKSGLYTIIEHKIVWAENINQAAQFAASGNADVAFVALSNVMGKEMTGKGKFYELSDNESSPIPQSGIILKEKKTTEAQLFFDFIRSEKSKRIWKKYGYQSEIKF
ncbi:molybdate ABC transporter substrate-binding protein [Chryseobacterium indologenes]|uniref:molybdate ABC transporter substrate-binding protein n=1 Tax=Chryseobacterium indologenes TaxID=253 RepID=UPI0030196CAF